MAQTTAGLTGADLENLMNEAAILRSQSRTDRPYISQEDISKSFVKVGIGAEKKSRVDLREGEDASPPTTRQAMRSCSMCCRMWDRYTYDLHHSDRHGSSRLYHAPAGEG